MKIISLNAFGGTVFAPLMTFVEEMALDTDVFCFQEVMSDLRSEDGRTDEQGFCTNLLKQLSRRLPEFVPFFAPVPDESDIALADRGFVKTGLATFVRKGIDVVSNGYFLLCDDSGSRTDVSRVAYNALHVTLRTPDSSRTILNVHGIALPGDKLDTPARLVQSQKILTFLQDVVGEKMVMGDFNLLPETESVGMLERAGFRNLIKDYAIQTTRGTHHRVLHPEFGRPPMTFQDFADFTFVSSGVSVRDFVVPDVPISDHLPMILRVI